MRWSTQAAHPALMPNWGSLSVIQGRVYGITSAAFFRIGQSTFAPEVLVDGLAADWYGVPRVAVDEGKQVYAIKGRNLVRMTGLDAPQLDVSVTSRCIAGKVVLAVTVANKEAVPVDLVVDAGFGSRSFSAVQPGKNAFHTFSTRSKDIAAGSVTVHSSRLGGTPASGTTTVGYGASSCR